MWLFRTSEGSLTHLAQDGKVEDNLVPRPKLIGSLEGRTVTQIGAGKAHTLALTKEGEVLSFGLQTYGRLGRKEANTSSDKPLGPGIVELPGEDRVIALGAGRVLFVQLSEASFLWRQPA